MKTLVWCLVLIGNRGFFWTRNMLAKDLKLMISLKKKPKNLGVPFENTQNTGGFRGEKDCVLQEKHWNIVNFLWVQEQWIVHLILNVNMVLSLFFFSVRILGSIYLVRFLHPPVKHTSTTYLPSAVIRSFLSFSLNTMCMCSLDPSLE